MLSWQAQRRWELHSHLQQVEEAEEVIKRTISNPKGKPYRHLVDICLAQKTKLVQDIKYDMDSKFDAKLVMTREYIRSGH